MAKSKSIKAAPRAINEIPEPISRTVVLNLGKNMVYELVLSYYEGALADGNAYLTNISVKNANGKIYSFGGTLEEE